jgi:hypothetical protein
MDGYKSSFASEEIKSFYFEELSPKPCYSDLCVRYDNKKLDFIEKNFDDNERKGIYTIHYTL